MGRLSTSGFVCFPRSDRNIDRLTLAAYPVVATTLKLRSARCAVQSKISSIAEVLSLDPWFQMTCHIFQHLGYKAEFRYSYDIEVREVM